MERGQINKMLFLGEKILHDFFCLLLINWVNEYLIK